MDDIDLTIQKNEFLTIIGPSGCGKTTLLRIIASLIQPEQGTVTVNGRDVHEPSTDRAMVFQSFGLFPWKTVIDNVTFPLTVRGDSPESARQTAEHYLAKVGLANHMSKHPHQLSGGMQQRVGLARALATEAEVLLMDEPFGAIDAQTREVMQEELMHLWNESRKTVIFVTHDLDEAVLLADRVMLLTPGPGRVRLLRDVELPRPRWDYDVRSHQNFTSVRGELWDKIRGDVHDD
nr:ABC transporter ATP-binding protein [Ornithinimicrobium sp. HY1745]